MHMLQQGSPGFYMTFDMTSYMSESGGVMYPKRQAVYKLPRASFMPPIVYNGKPYVYLGTAGVAAKPGYAECDPNNAIILRTLTGGKTYLGANGLPSATDAGLGAYPPTNEWDKYIVKSNLNGKVTPNDPNVWHHDAVATITQSVPPTSVGKIVQYRVARKLKEIKNIIYNNGSGWGWRPVVEFKDSMSRNVNLWR